MSEYVIELNEFPTITVDGWNVRCDDLMIQREKIVRCRDCAHYQPGYCKHFECMEHQISVNEDDFCSFGVERNGD